MRKLILLSLLLAACSIDAPDYSADDGGDDIDADTGTGADVTLTIMLVGDNGGTVTAPEGIDCGEDCTLTAPAGTTVTLTATPEANTNFTGWSGGGCSGTAPCELTLTADTTVEAAFDLSRFTLTVTPGGNGTGTVTSDPTGIVCGDDCVEDYDVGTPVTLTATPNAGSTFLGWTGGGCTGTAPCIVEIGADLEVEASFALDNSIVVTLDGNGTGGVTSNPAGITCEDDCFEAYAPGTPVTLTALATGDSVFDGWDGGGCTGTGTCQVTTDTAVLVTATFILNQHTLEVVVTGTGSGGVTSNPAGIDCGLDCNHAYDSGTPVTLTATPTAGKFAGWMGDCSGLGNCNLVLGLERSVTATFTLITVGNVTSTTANGIYTRPTSIPILLTFSDPVIVTGTPTLALDTGGVASYASGSGSNTLTFTYVVASGQASSDLDYSDTTALALAGGTIRNALGNNATLTLPIPGAAGSLGANKALVIDAVLPVVLGLTGPSMYARSTGATLSFTVSDVHPSATSNCTLTAGTGTISVCSTIGATLTGLNQGAHTLQVTHTDTAGNVSVAQTWSWTVDTVAPVISTIAGVPLYATSAYAASTDAPLTYAIGEANLGSTTCTHSVGSGTEGSCTDTGVSYTGLSQGLHTVTITHTDAAGNSVAQTKSWTVDTVAPMISTIAGVPLYATSTYAASTDAPLTYTIGEANLGSTTCDHSVGTGTQGSCTATGVGYTGLSQGLHTVTITHTDAAGNSVAQTKSWTVDTVAPMFLMISGPPNPTTLTTATLSYTISDANLGSTVCNQTLGTGTQTGCNNTTATYTGLGSGLHTVSVTHTDLAGNVASASASALTWSVCAESTVVFSTGTTFTVPAGCSTRMDVYAWGAGGGGGRSGIVEGGNGGGGGFAGGTLTVAPGQVFSIAVGGGGASAGGGGSVGGGTGAAGGNNGGTGAGGAGWSGVFAGSTYHVIAAGAGGGGGGAGGIAGTNSIPGWRGGGGGGGGDGGDGMGGSPGTLIAGGAGGTTEGGGNAGTNGAIRQGGNGGSGVPVGATHGGGGGGGGGAGYFGGGGGGGGGSCFGGFYCGGGGGGGGSNFTSASVTNSTTMVGSSPNAGNNTSPYYLSPRGNGGGAALSGNAGRVVIVVR